MGFDGMQAANKNTCTRNVEVEFLVENVLEDRQFSPWITAPADRLAFRCDLFGWLHIMTFFSSTASEFTTTDLPI